MSRRDARKAVTLSLPESLRKALVRQSEARVPLAYLVRQTLRRAMDAERGWDETVAQGDRRPILLQLSCEDRVRLETWMTAKQVDEAEAILSLIGCFLKDESGKPAKPEETARRGRR